jgi:hypothetical protein
MNTLTMWAIAIALTIGLGYFAAKDSEDHAGEWPTSAALKELQAEEEAAERRQRIGQALCTEERGPNSEARWTIDGSLVCTTQRGLVAVQP